MFCKQSLTLLLLIFASVYSQQQGAATTALNGVNAIENEIGGDRAENVAFGIRPGYGGFRPAFGGGFGPGNGQYGPGMGRFGTGNGRFGQGNEQFGPGNGQFGPGNGQFGPGNGQFGPGRGPFGQGMGPFGPGMGPFGPGMRPFGPGMGPIRPGIEAFGPGSRLWNEIQNINISNLARTENETSPLSFPERVLKMFLDRLPTELRKRIEQFFENIKQADLSTTVGTPTVNSNEMLSSTMPTNTETLNQADSLASDTVNAINTETTSNNSA